MSWKAFVPAVVGLWSVLAPLTASAATYPQLMATKYENGAPLPEGVARPEPTFDEVDRSKLPDGAKVTAAARSASGRLWVVTDRGPFRSTADGFEPLEVGPRHPEPGQPEVHWNTRVQTVTADPLGTLWVGTDRGVFLCDGEQWWRKLGREDGVPFEDVRQIHLARNGDVWAATPAGAWRLRDGLFRYFAGRRWLPDDDVQAVWTDSQGRAWLATATGTARIEDRPTTLAEKAAHYERIVRARHDRRGYIAGIDLKAPGDLAGAVFDVSDNDGLWTAMYIGAQALRFGATKDPAAREAARKSMNALLDLERLSGIPGFPARAVVSDEELAAGARGFSAEGKVHAVGVDAKVWYRSPKAPGLWCKGDTSSDELDGHYFAWYLYHDLVADDAEKAEIAAVARRVTDWILANNLTLVDHTGKATRWGVWSPELINKDPLYHALRPLNSLEILMFLKVAEHLTGDARYAEAADGLIKDHHYLLNGLLMRRGKGEDRWADINHSDDELLYLSYYPLLMLEKDPAKRRLLTQSIARTWEPIDGEQTLRPERSPFYNFVYGATTGRRCDVEDARETLRDWPWDLIAWNTRNSHRHDVRLRQQPGLRRTNVHLDRVLSPAERTQTRWNSDPWRPDQGADGRHEADGVAFSIAYWLGVYHGYLSPDE